MHLNVDNFFSQYLPQAEEVTLSNGTVIQIKKLSYGQSQTISNASIKNISSDGTPEIDFEEAQRSKFKKISAALVEPKMTVKQLEALSEEADDIIDEIFAIVDPKTWQSIEDAKESKEEEED